MIDDLIFDLGGDLIRDLILGELLTSSTYLFEDGVDFDFEDGAPFVFNL